MPEAFTRRDAAKHLRTKEDVRLYLEVRAEGDLGGRQSDPRCPERHCMGAEQESGGSSRRDKPPTALYKAFVENGNPNFSRSCVIPRALGMQL